MDLVYEIVNHLNRRAEIDILKTQGVISKSFLEKNRSIL